MSSPALTIYITAKGFGRWQAYVRFPSGRQVVSQASHPNTAKRLLVKKLKARGISIDTDKS